MKSFLLVLCVALSVVGCNSSKNMAKLSGVKWVLQTLNDKELSRVNGRGGCNRFFGNYEMESSRLKFSPMGATRMACPDLQTETEFFQMLDGVDGYSIKDNKLSFLSKNKVVAVFKKAEEAK